MAVPSVPLFGNPTRVTADVAIKASPGKLWAMMLVGASAANAMAFHNHASSATGDPIMDIVAPFTDEDGSAASVVFVSFLELGGIDFSTGIFVNWTGAGAIGYVWFS